MLLEKHQHETIILNAESDGTAREIASLFGGKATGSQVVLESDGADSNALICKIVNQFVIRDFKIAKKDDEEIIAEILKK